MSETTNTPNPPDPKKADAATHENTKIDAAPTTTPAKPASRKRTLLIAGGSVLAVALLAGGGIAVGAAMADEHDGDDDGTTATSVADQDDEGGRDDDARDDGKDDTTLAAGSGATSASELSEIIAAAASEAEGTPVSLDANSDGSWDVEFRTDAGDETEVRVADGSAKVISTEAADADDANDPAPQGALDAATVKALVDAALGEVDGRVVELDVDDDTTSPYDVSVLTGDGRTVEVSLDADVNVVTSGTDD
ncbi:PepSY domain-containing protein [Agromyces sp. Leaf222]|uniref:PepSY domain-containing protein n=1 Tax=Agromyces sp. Leaf222 TaxID=1735688 RepID=UPI0006FC9A85|nr:hypothetical protein [Agromyces sp. Leaf222]KQM82591.1 hypothetical protein ASE68_04250 [Agromyces sp. Leaf222]